MGQAQPKPADQIFHVTPELENQTLAKALRHWLTNRAWSKVQKLIEDGWVMVSGNVCKDIGRRLQAGEAVKLLSQPAPEQPQETDVRVQYLDEHLIVVEKPSGITTNRHREERRWSKRRKQIQPTLDELLPQIIAKIEGRKNHRGVPLPVRAVHRIDRDTSGLIVFARTHGAERIMAQQFRQHATHRRYLAIVEGLVKAQTISTRLVRDRGDGRRGSTAEPEVGKAAITHVKPLATLKQFTLLQCRLETGRTHQIRIHLSELGHPVCGEKIYRSKRAGRITADSTAAPRLALHAAELGFVHPVSGKPLRFQSNLPTDLADFWHDLQHQDKAAKPSSKHTLPGS